MPRAASNNWLVMIVVPYPTRLRTWGHTTVVGGPRQASPPLNLWSCAQREEALPTTPQDKSK
jgi:hypothetical protein